MSVALKCSRCEREMHSTGMRGLCPACLFACTTSRWANPAEAEPVTSAIPSAARGEEVLVAEAAVGPDNRFLLLDKLGEGGMGEVWLADDQALSQPGEPQFVALKFLSQSIRRNPRALAAIRAEVLRSQKLAHPNIVRIFDLHMTRGGAPFIKMEFVEGNSLSRWLRENNYGQVMPWRMAVPLIHQLVSALQYAHHNVGIVHRDLKPANLLLAEGGTLKLTDFGIARPIYERDNVERDGGLIGTLAYASPQQVAGGRPDPSDDIYSLGATLYELLTGTPPFSAETAAEITRKIQYETPQRIPQRLQELDRENEVPPKVVQLVSRCLEKDPLLRPKLTEVTRFLPPPNAPVSASRSGGNLPATEMEVETAARKHDWSWLWSVLLFAILAGGIAVWQNWGGVRSYLPAEIQSWLTGRGGSGQSARAPNRPVIAPVKTNDNTNHKAGDGPSASDSNSQAVATDALPGSSELSVTIVPANPRYQDHFYLVTDERNGAVTDGRLRPGTSRLPLKLSPGRYHFRVSESATKLELTEAFTVTGGALPELKFRFTLNEDLTVTSDPPGALIRWPRDAIRAGTTTEARSPFTHRFRSGMIQFIAKKPRYFETTNNYQFNPAVSRELVIPLTLSPYPLAGENWTNSLGMAFMWVSNRSIAGLWVCATETRVRDFRRFVDATHYDATAELYSVTTNRLERVGASWIQPGLAFAQTDAHPVAGVNWEDATNFCAWLTRVERATNGLKGEQFYRLPTRDEWNKLVGDQRHPLSNPAKLVGNFAGREITNAWPTHWFYLTSQHDNYPRTAPVYAPEFPPNEFGLRHMAGNVAEWCEDQTLAGGSWRNGVAADLNDLAKFQTEGPLATDPGKRQDWQGFRVVIFRTPTGN